VDGCRGVPPSRTCTVERRLRRLRTLGIERAGANPSRYVRPSVDSSMRKTMLGHSPFGRSGQVGTEGVLSVVAALTSSPQGGGGFHSAEAVSSARAAVTAVISLSMVAAPGYATPAKIAV
jgi:hypothetical protein